MLFDWIPIQLAFGLHGDVMGQTSRTRPVAYFCRRDGRLSALDTIQPIAMLVVTLIKMNLVGTDNAVEDFGIAGNQRLRGRRRFPSRFPSRIGGRDHLVPGDKNPTLTAIEL